MDEHSSPRDPMIGAGSSAAQPGDDQGRSALAASEVEAGTRETGEREMATPSAGESGRRGRQDVGGPGGNGRRGGRANTGAWLIGILVVLVAVFAGLRYAGRAPAPTRPAPTRPAPTRPAPSVPAPTPAPTAPAPTLADLKRDLTDTESAIARKDWAAASTQVASLRARWQSLRSRVRSADTTKDVTAFDSRLRELTNDINAREEADARADVAELRAIVDRLDVTPTRASTAG